jgi:hypothetical protein
MGPLPNFPIDKIFWLAMIGLAACVIVTLGAVGSLIWFIVNHVQFI